MEIKDSYIDKIMEEYNKYDYCNIFITGEEGTGKTFMSKILVDKILKKSKQKFSSDIFCYNFEDFISCKEKIRMLDENPKFMKLNEIKIKKKIIEKEILNKINIFQIDDINKVTINLSNINYIEFRCLGIGIFEFKYHKSNF